MNESIITEGYTIPKEGYNIIYADPPWKYKTKDRLQGCAESNYKTMNVEDICELPVNELANKNSVLFLWVTFPQLKEGLRVVEAWGFEYKTVAFTWVKTNKKSIGQFLGMGFWTRSNAEICLLATKGKIKRQRKDIRQLIFSPIRRHSEKPPEVRDRIVKLIGNLPRIELFARIKAKGWDAWGNEIVIKEVGLNDKKKF